MTHDFQGNQYRKASTHQQEWGQALIDALPLYGDEHILDLGCGDGRLTALLADRCPGGQVVGIDASPGMLAVAQPLARSNLTFLQMDINDLPFTEEFDLIFSNAALHWVIDHQKLLGKVYRALLPGGTARFNFAGDGNCANFFRVVREVMAIPRFAAAFVDFVWPWYMPSIEQYQALAMSVSFREIQVWGENADRFFPDAETMIRWVDQPSLVPFLPVLPEQDRPTFRDTVVERMVSATRQADGRCFETFRRINLDARK